MRHHIEDLSYLDPLSIPLSKEDIRFHFSYLHEPSSSDRDHLQLLLKSSLKVRQAFLFYHSEDLNNTTLVGIQQILDGGPVINPNASEVSVEQNDAHFPNIKYSEETIIQLQDIAQQYKQALEELPDISDLGISSKMRKKRDLSYIVRELPKNPLDVTFGNDASCCIYVPEDVRSMQNGFSVPYFLTDQNIRLFGVYRIDNNKEQRMGLVLAFDTNMESDPDTKILTANSLELSRFGIAGGNETIRALSDYVENWLVGYAQQYGYDGVVMGSHSYNTSVNFSSKVGDKLHDRLVFSGGRSFYSDIFVLDRDQDLLKTRNNGLYVLWKK